MKISKAQAKKLGIDVPPRTKVKTPTGDKAWFLAMCTANGLPEPKPEYKFHSKRKWRLDWLFENAMGELIALEIEGLGKGGSAGRHQQIGGWLKDMEKYNEATIMGVRIIRATTRQVNDGSAFALVRRALYG